MLYRVSQVIGRILLWIGFRVRLEGLENIPKEGAYIVVANHSSFLDPFLMAAYIPRIINYLMYAQYYFLPSLHWYCKRTYCLPLKKDGKDISALKNALRLLKSGELVGIFPEGERSLTGELGPGAPGVALMAIKARVPILPIGLIGTFEAFPRGAKFPRLRSPITIRYGRPFRIEDEIQRPENGKNGEYFQQQATDLIMRKIAGLCV